MAKGKKTGGKVKGSRNLRTLAREAELAQSGLMPREYMLAVMRDPKNPEERRDAMAKAVAPYCHPTFAAVKVMQTNPNDDAIKQLPERNGLDELIDPFRGVNKAPPVINGTTNGKGETH